jgi:hypothetical protein
MTPVNGIRKPKRCLARSECSRACTWLVPWRWAWLLKEAARGAARIWGGWSLSDYIRL